MCFLFFFFTWISRELNFSVISTHATRIYQNFMNMLHKQNMSCFLTCLQKLGHSAIRVNVIILRLPFPCHDSVVFFSAARSAPPSHACCRYTTHPPAVLPWVCTCSHQLSPLYTKTTTTKFNHYCDALNFQSSWHLFTSKNQRKIAAELF